MQEFNLDVLHNLLPRVMGEGGFLKYKPLQMRNFHLDVLLNPVCPNLLVQNGNSFKGTNKQVNLEPMELTSFKFRISNSLEIKSCTNIK